jgi:hypothetical protein
MLRRESTTHRVPSIQVNSAKNIQADDSRDRLNSVKLIMASIQIDSCKEDDLDIQQEHATRQLGFSL